MLRYDPDYYILDMRNEVDQKVLKTLMGVYGNAQFRKAYLGDAYNTVQAKVNKFASFLLAKRSVFIRAYIWIWRIMSKQEFTKYEREHYILDIRSRLDQKVIKTLMGVYGEFPEIVNNLGKDYEAVHKRVSEITTYLEHKHL